MCQVHIQPFRDMIDGMRMDLVKSRYRTYDELYGYCYKVAGTVALMTTPVMGIDPGYPVRPARDCYPVAVRTLISALECVGSVQKVMQPVALPVTAAARLAARFISATLAGYPTPLLQTAVLSVHRPIMYRTALFVSLDMEHGIHIMWNTACELPATACLLATLAV